MIGYQSIYNSTFTCTNRKHRVTPQVNVTTRSSDQGQGHKKRSHDKVTLITPGQGQRAREISIDYAQSIITDPLIVWLHALVGHLSEGCFLFGSLGGSPLILSTVILPDFSCIPGEKIDQGQVTHKKKTFKHRQRIFHSD